MALSPAPTRFFCAALLFALTACSAPEATIQLGGSLSVLSITEPFDIDELPDGWVTRGNIPQGAVAGNMALGISTFAVTSSNEPFLIARRISANLLATPYLSWRWRLESGNGEYHPVRIIIGFAGGGSETIPYRTLSKLFPGTTLPDHDRMLSLIWAPSALMRGSLSSANTDKASDIREAHYIVRGGAENTGFWWPETVDLASLYKMSWPTDKQTSTHVTFIGLSSAPSKSQLSAYITDLRLSR